MLLCQWSKNELHLLKISPALFQTIWRSRSVNAQHLNLPNGDKWVFKSFQALRSQRTSFEGHGWYVFSNCHLISVCLSPFSSFLLLPPPPVNPTPSLRDLYISLLGWPPLMRPCLVILLLPMWSPVFGSIYSANLTASSKAEIWKSLGRICSEGGQEAQ